MWKGAIAFGLVNIPVGLTSAEDRTETGLHMVDSKNNARIRYQKVNAETGEEVPWERLVKGFEHEEGHFVFLDESELEGIKPKLTKTIEITQFVKLEDIEPLLFEKPYYLEPEKRGKKAYALLRETMRETGMAGISRVVVRTKEYLCAMFVRDEVIVLMALRFPDEIRSPKKLDLPETSDPQYQPGKKEMELAKRLVEDMTEEWKPEDHHDEYQAALLEYIDKKLAQGASAVVKGGDRREEPSIGGGNVVDLAEYLQKSLKAGGKSKPAPKGPAKPAAKKAAKKAAKRAAKKSA